MYKKFLVLASKEDEAGMNILAQLSQFKKSPILEEVPPKDRNVFDIMSVEDSILYEGNLNPGKISEYDFIIFASRHSSEKKEKALTVHAPGNWKGADFGGQQGKACKSSALFQKHLFKKLNENAGKAALKKYQVTLEATHHGPLIDKPCVFIEIGSTETEWKDKRAGFAVAKTISEAVAEFRHNPYNEIAIGLGGPHYCPEFNKIQLNSNIAISHIIPKYISPITEEIVRESWKKTQEEPDFILVDWKGLGNAEERQKFIGAIERTRLPWKKISEIGR